MVDAPSVKLRDLLSGKTAWDDADPAIRSWSRLSLWKGAKVIAAEKDPKKRKAMMSKIPITLRPEVQKIIDTL